MAAGNDSAWLHELYEMFAPVREDAKDLSEDEIDAIIDQAIAEARTIRSQPYETWPADMHDRHEALRSRFLKTTADARDDTNTS